MAVINFVSCKDQAIQKINAEQKQVSGSKEKAMANAVFQVVHDFCLQEERFAQAVVDGGTFADCMKAVAKGVGNSISDLDAYKKAVKFYLPDADIKIQMSIQLPGDSAPEPTPSNNPLVLDLFDLL
jgi:hypothetical protein